MDVLLPLPCFPRLPLLVVARGAGLPSASRPLLNAGRRRRRVCRSSVKPGGSDSFERPCAVELSSPCSPSSPSLVVSDVIGNRPQRPGRPRRRPRAGAALRDVMLVGNNWAGTATIVDARTHKVLKRGVNLIPDKDQELADIRTDPEKLAFYLAIQQGPGEGHDQYVDDMFTTTRRQVPRRLPAELRRRGLDRHRQGRRGRPDSIVREQQMDGYRTDHMGLSPDGRRLLVTDSTERQVIEYSMVDETVDGTTIAMGDRLRTFESGETPHESNYTEDGSRIFHASHRQGLHAR